MICKDSAEHESSPEITGAEKYCREQDAEHPDLVLKDNAWPELSTTLRKHDEDQVKAHNENIDTLLVLVRLCTFICSSPSHKIIKAGLFSAIVTAFIIEAYKLLQPDPTDISIQILLQISHQLNSLSVTPGFINSTYLPTPSPPFSPSWGSVCVNALWFAALVLSLVTASLGMLVKQWLREYLSNSHVSPEQCCHVRLFRVRGLRRYKVTEIASFLPILLQIALALFFIGLVMFIRNIHASIASLVIVLVGIWLLFVVSTTLLPMVSPSCPYKTPVLHALFFQFRSLLNTMTKSIKYSSTGRLFHILPDYLFAEENTKRMSAESKAEVLVDAYDTFNDTKSWDIAMRCIDLNSPSESLHMLSSLVEKAHGSEITSSSIMLGLFDQSQLRLLLKSMTMCFRRAYILARKNDQASRFGKIEAVALITLRRLYRAFRTTGDSDRALDKMASLLTRHEEALSVSHRPEFISSYILLGSGLSQNPSSVPRLGELHGFKPDWANHTI